jgi:hypothetical protein
VQHAKPVERGRCKWICWWSLILMIQMKKRTHRRSQIRIHGIRTSRVLWPWTTTIILHGEVPFPIHGIKT